MILVVLGTQDKTFERLLKKIENEILLGNIKDDVVVQAGNTKYKSDNMKIFDFIDMDKFSSLIKECDLLITHGGAGTILDGIKNDKKVIAVPRLSKYGEHVNDHQIQIIDEFSKLGYIMGCEDLDNLGNCIKKVSSFKPKKYISSNDKMIDIINDFINKS